MFLTLTVASAVTQSGLSPNNSTSGSSFTKPPSPPSPPPPPRTCPHSSPSSRLPSPSPYWRLDIHPPLGLGVAALSAIAGGSALAVVEALLLLLLPVLHPRSSLMQGASRGSSVPCRGGLLAVSTVLPVVVVVVVVSRRLLLLLVADEEGGLPLSALLLTLTLLSMFLWLAGGDEEPSFAVAGVMRRSGAGAVGRLATRLSALTPRGSSSASGGLSPGRAGDDPARCLPVW